MVYFADSELSSSSVAVSVVAWGCKKMKVYKQR